MKSIVQILLLSISMLCLANAEIVTVRVSLDEATRQVIGNGNYRVLGAQTEVINGREVHVIKVLTPDGRIKYFKVDAETGALIG